MNRSTPQRRVPPSVQCSLKRPRSAARTSAGVAAKTFRPCPTLRTRLIFPNAIRSPPNTHPRYSLAKNVPRAEMPTLRAGGARGFVQGIPVAKHMKLADAALHKRLAAGSAGLCRGSVYEGHALHKNPGSRHPIVHSRYYDPPQPRSRRRQTIPWRLPPLERAVSPGKTRP